MAKTCGALARLNQAGGFSISVDTAVDDPSGVAGFEFLLDITYQTICESAPLEGDVLIEPAHERVRRALRVDADPVVRAVVGDRRRAPAPGLSWRFCARR